MKKKILSSSFLLANKGTERSTSLKRISPLNDKNQKNVIFTTSQQIKPIVVCIEEIKKKELVVVL